MQESDKIATEAGEEPQLIIEEKMIPIKKSGVSIREEMEEDGKYVLFDAETEHILVVNSTGHYILKNCIGEKTVGDIINSIKNEFSIDEDIDIKTVVHDFISRGVRFREWCSCCSLHPPS